MIYKDSNILIKLRCCINLLQPFLKEIRLCTQPYYSFIYEYFYIRQKVL